MEKCKEQYLDEIINNLETELIKLDRILEEMHDIVLSKVFGSRLSLGLLSKKIEVYKTKKDLQYIVAELNHLEKEVRDIFLQIDNEILDFIDIIKKNLIIFTKYTNIKHTIYNNIEWTSINNSIKLNLYRIILELLCNVKKHSKATNINLFFSKKENDIVFEFKDNRTGFISNTKNKGKGIKNIYSRAERINSEISMTSNTNHGTCIKLLISQSN